MLDCDVFGAGVVGRYYGGYEWRGGEYRLVLTGGTGSA